MSDAPYPPQSPSPFDRIGDEQHLHSLVLRGYRYAPARTEPIHEDYVVHLTTRRLVLLPDDEAPAAPADDHHADEDHAAHLSPPGPIALPWNDLIEIRTARGSQLPDTLPGAEEHMLLIEARSREAHEFAEMFLFTVEPLCGAQPAERPAHGLAFIEVVEEFLLDAFDG